MILFVLRYALIFILAVVMIAWITRQLSGYLPSTLSFNAFLRSFRKKASKHRNSLTRIDPHEAELFSSHRQKSRFLKKANEGILTSIYEEPICYYAFHQYPNGQTILGLVEFKSGEWVINKSRKNCKIYRNHKLFARFDGTKMVFGRNSFSVVEEKHKQEWHIRLSSGAEFQLILNGDGPGLFPRLINITNPIDSQGLEEIKAWVCLYLLGILKS